MIAALDTESGQSDFRVNAFAPRTIIGRGDLDAGDDGLELCTNPGSRHPAAVIRRRELARNPTRAALMRCLQR